ncbi:hypothetical protein BGZ83_008047 [Gryganskiella cystojenkinii]|nr:hypothetical protein BGZ83_008047 [Gryganskiella cystojenkinii]
MAPLKKIALITCSTRKPRVNPFISAHVRSILTPAIAPEAVILEDIDLVDHTLPLFDEPLLPVRHPADNPTPHYKFEHTRDWSAKIKVYDAYIFVTPQYNWSIPASLKTALDSLYHEWRGKPVGIIAYGGHGGTKSSKHLREILTGAFEMKVAATAINLWIPYTLDVDSSKLGHVPEEKVQSWKEDGSEDKIRQMFEEVVVLLQ